MAKTPGKAAKAKEKQESVTRTDDLEESVEKTLEQFSESDEGLEADLSAWEADNRLENDEVRYVLFRKRIGLQGLGKEQVWEWIDEMPPSKHQIGLTFGGGPFVLKGVLPFNKKYGNRILVRKFILAESYTEALKKANPQMSGAPNMYQPPAVRSEMEVMAMLADKFFTPMLKMVTEARQPAPGMAALAQEFSKSINEVVVAGAKAQIQNAKEMSKELTMLRQQAERPLPPVNMDPAAPPNEWDYKDLIKDFFKTHGQELLEAGKLKLLGFADALKKNEVFRTLADDPVLLSKVEELIYQDPEMAESPMTGKLLQKLSSLNIGLMLPVRRVPGPAPVESETVPDTNGAGAPHPSPSPQGTPQ